MSNSTPPQITTHQQQPFSSNIPQDVLNMKHLLAEYGFTPNNADPCLIHQLLSIVNQTSMDLLTKSDIIRDATGSKEAISDKTLQLVLKPLDDQLSVLEQTRAQFLQAKLAHDAHETTPPPHPETTPAQSLPISLDTLFQVQDDYSIAYANCL